MDPRVPTPMLKVMSLLLANWLSCIYGSFRKLGVPTFFGPYSKDPTIWGTMRVPYFRYVALVPLANVSIVHRELPAQCSLYRLFRTVNV